MAAITLRAAQPADRLRVYRWLTEPAIAAFMFGPPRFPEATVPTWEEFIADYRDHFFDGSDPSRGQCYIVMQADVPVGQINHGDIFGMPPTTELDLWLAGAEFLGLGYGPAAVDLLCKRLATEQAVRRFILRPSARNERAVRAYQKAGFRRKDWALGCIEAAYGPCDYGDCVLLVREES